MGELALIVANGEVADVEIIRARINTLDSAQVIAVDGGSKNCQLLGMDYDVILGDLDSLQPGKRQSLQKSGVRIENFPTLKNETDLELALLHAVNHGIQEIILLGTIGGRLDMTLSNVYLLAHPHLNGVSVRIWHNDQTAWLIRPPGDEIEGRMGDTLSLIPIGSAAQGITTHDLVYRLDGESLNLGPARGISNVLKSSNARVDLQDGMLLAIHTPGRA
jgi:thiamine pyrophosphokinase